MSLYGSLARPSRPQFSGYFEGQSLNVSVAIRNRNEPIMHDTLIEVGFRCELPAWLARFLDWLLPDRRFSDPAENKGWCVSRA